MLSRNTIKEIQSLKQAKFRRKLGLFIAEGPKTVVELLNSRYKVNAIYCLPEILPQIEQHTGSDLSLITIGQKDLERISTLKTPNQVLAVFSMEAEQPDPPDHLDDLILILDNISDPGNMGTIIRTADWFGIENIVCSEDCVDRYNPKVVQATMGSLARVMMFYTKLEPYLQKISQQYEIYAAVLGGENLYRMQLDMHAALLIGSESHGISEKLLPFIKNRVSIPPFVHPHQGHAESLNASVATAIICSEFRRQKKYG